MIKLIIIEDELQMLEHLSIMLDWASLGFEIAGLFSNGIEAKNYIDKNPVDCILSDIEIPFMSGIELAKYCHENFPEIKIVFISAYRNFEYALEAIQYGILNYITKPIVYSKFLQTMSDTATLFEAKNDLTEYNTRSDSALISDKVTDYICKNYKTQISLNSAAEYVHLNSSYLSRLFKRETGKNFSEYLLDFRINKATELLASSKQNISSIAFDVGFTDVHHFYKTFKRKIGVSANQYRKNIQRG